MPKFHFQNPLSVPFSSFRFLSRWHYEDPHEPLGLTRPLCCSWKKQRCGWDLHFHRIVTTKQFLVCVLVQNLLVRLAVRPRTRPPHAFTRLGCSGPPTMPFKSAQYILMSMKIGPSLRRFGKFRVLLSEAIRQPL